jgi:ferredoxin
MCALIAPEVFDQDPEGGQTVLLQLSPDAQHHEAVHDAVQTCPVAAIRVIADDIDQV